MSRPAATRVAAAAEEAIAARGASGWVGARRDARQGNWRRPWQSAAKSNPASGRGGGNGAGKLQREDAEGAGDCGEGTDEAGHGGSFCFAAQMGLRTTAKTGTREKIATRVVAETHVAESETSTAGTAKRPRPTAIALHN